VADQFIGQCIGGRQRSGFCQSGDIFQQTFDLFANNVWIRQTLQNIELNFANRIELNETLVASSPSASATSKLVIPAEAESTTRRTLASESTTSALWFIASKFATLVPPNLATTSGETE
jgi:hypothetical protein